MGRAKPRRDQDEKELEKLAKKLLSTPHKPREESKGGKKLRAPASSDDSRADRDRRHKRSGP